MKEQGGAWRGGTASFHMLLCLARMELQAEKSALALQKRRWERRRAFFAPCACFTLTQRNFSDIKNFSLVMS